MLVFYLRILDLDGYGWLRFVMLDFFFGFNVKVGLFFQYYGVLIVREFDIIWYFIVIGERLICEIVV